MINICKNISHLLIYILLIFVSCSPVRQTASGLKIKGLTTVKVFKDKSLKDKSIVQGYVYSRLDSCFLDHANILIDREAKVGVVSDSNGFFNYSINPGLYTIECDFIGHVKEKRQIEIKKGQRVLIIFELGTNLIY